MWGVAMPGCLTKHDATSSQAASQTDLSPSRASSSQNAQSEVALRQSIGGCFLTWQARSNPLPHSQVMTRPQIELSIKLFILALIFAFSCAVWVVVGMLGIV